MVSVRRVTAADSQLLSPSATGWEVVPGEPLSLEPTPLLSQPSAYVQAKWKDIPHGAVKEISVQAVHNGASIFFRLSWPDPTKDDAISDTDVFSDAAAILFPAKGDAPLTSMGSPEQPVFAWYWRPDLEEPYHITAQGIGSSIRGPARGIAANAEYADGGWRVVISRRLSGKGTGLLLAPGATGKVAFAVWQGSEGERGGLKSVTLEWQPLEIEA